MLSHQIKNTEFNLFLRIKQIIIKRKMKLGSAYENQIKSNQIGIEFLIQKFNKSRFP